MSERDAIIRHTASNRITSGPGMVSGLDDENNTGPQHSVNAEEQFDSVTGANIAKHAVHNGFDRMCSSGEGQMLETEGKALAAMRAYATPGPAFDVDKLICAAAAYKFHTQK